MDIEEIKTLTDLMVEHDLSEIMLRDGEKRVLLRRGQRAAPPALVGTPMAPAAPVMPQPAAPAPAAPAAAPAPAPADDPGLAQIKSPMVGTFYATPDPDSPPYVKIGDRVTPDTVVAIIEAMKVFNEIKAEVSGTIESIDIESGQPVEFGQTIMTVRVG